jgi:hypothetical protein
MIRTLTTEGTKKVDALESPAPEIAGVFEVSPHCDL